MSTPLLKYTCIGFLLLALSSLEANYLSVQNVGFAQLDTAANRVTIRFDLDWQNSWRTSTAPGNHDAAWVFVKFFVDGSEGWKHATLRGSQTINGVTIDRSSDQKGAFVYRATDGAGSVDWDALGLEWDYGADGVQDYHSVSVKVYAIEMVYIPTATFSVGSGGSQEYYPLQQVRPNGNQPYPIDSEAAIAVGNNTGELTYGAGSNGGGGDGAGPIPAPYPKGYAGFYCMKYEVSQQQFTEFFAALTPGQRTVLDITDAAGKNTQATTDRNTLRWEGNLNPMTNSSPSVALNYVSPARAWAYLDWAGLRPMTELEYEKVARGPLAPVPDEFSWGTTELYQLAYTLADLDLDREVITNPTGELGNVLYHNTRPEAPAADGPARTGVVIGSRSDGRREQAGAGYYGVADLSGNVAELVVTVGDATGRGFTGSVGDGNLAENGRADVAGWPTATAGYGKRGGSYLSTWYELLTSDREFATYVTEVGEPDLGFRGVR